MKSWKIYLRGLPPRTDEITFRKHFWRKGSHVVRSTSETDPATHSRIGRSQIMLRYTPEKYDVESMPIATQDATSLWGAKKDGEKAETAAAYV